MTKTFLLGLGAQKAGTTWLHDYLSNADCTDLGFIKEYHFLDVRHKERDSITVRKRGFKRKLVEGARQLLQEDTISFEACPHIWVRLAWHSQPSLYYEYFTGLLRPSGVTLTGDLTPDNCILDASALREIYSQFSDRGVCVKPVFLMRDPVERIWSAIRMNRRKGKALVEDDDEKEILRRLKLRTVMERSSYHKTLSAIKAVFEPQDCFISLYEEVFTPTEISRLCSVLNIEYVPPDFEKHLNKTEKKSDISDEAVKAVAKHLEESYSAAAAHFGSEKILKLWPSAKYVLSGFQ